MNDTLLLAPDLLQTMRLAAHKAIELDEPIVTTRCILLALLDDEQSGRLENLDAMLERASAEEEAPCEQTLAFKTPDGSGTMRLSDRAYSFFIEGARNAANRYTKADLVAALAARAR